MSIKGLDVSKFQGEVDWERVKAAGYQFAMLRAGYGFSTVDEQFRRNASECSRIGLPFGAYWFCYAVSPETAVQEADGCINTISGYQLDYPVCYDIEQASADYAAGQGVQYTPGLARQLVQSFCDRVESYSYFAMFYRTEISWTLISEKLSQPAMHSGMPATLTPLTELTAACGSIPAREAFPASAAM